MAIMAIVIVTRTVIVIDIVFVIVIVIVIVIVVSLMDQKVLQHSEYRRHVISWIEGFPAKTGLPNIFFLNPVWGSICA